MNRITEIEIAGKKYPLNFSMKAARKFIERYGSVEDVWRKLNKMGQVKKLEEINWILALMMEQGCVYRKLTDGEDITPLAANELEVLMGFTDFAAVSDKIQEAIVAGITPEIELKLKKKAAEMGVSIPLDLPGATTTAQELDSSGTNTT